MTYVCIHHSGCGDGGPCKSCIPAPALDLTKPVQTQCGYSVRVLCTDRKHGRQVIGLIDCGTHEILWSWCRDGFGDDAPHYDLVQAPPPKEKHTCELVMHRSYRSGHVFTGKHDVGWMPKESTVLARKVVTLEEGEGM